MGFMCTRARATHPAVHLYMESNLDAWTLVLNFHEKIDIHRLDQLLLEFKILLLSKEQGGSCTVCGKTQRIALCLPLAWSRIALKLPLPESLKTLHWGGEKGSREVLTVVRELHLSIRVTTVVIFPILLQNTFVGSPCSDVCNFTGMSLAFKAHGTSHSIRGIYIFIKNIKSKQRCS